MGAEFVKVFGDAARGRGGMAGRLYGNENRRDDCWQLGYAVTVAAVPWGGPKRPSSQPPL